MNENKPIEEQMIDLLKLQIKVMDNLRVAVEKLEKRIKGDLHPVAFKDSSVVDLIGKQLPPRPPLDDRI